jgi:hypothetical protein
MFAKSLWLAAALALGGVACTDGDQDQDPGQNPVPPIDNKVDDPNDPGLDMIVGDHIVGSLTLDDGTRVMFSSTADSARVVIDGLVLSYDQGATSGTAFPGALDREALMRLRAAVEAELKYQNDTPAERNLIEALDGMLGMDVAR